MDGPAGYTNVNYWDDVAQDYDGEIMSSFDEDLKRIIHKRVCEHCQGPVSSFALDLGCGVGKYLPLLATRCSKVLGVDISNELLTQAQRLCDPFSNVKLRCVDLGNYVLDAHTTGDLPLHQATFLVCANVIISPDQTVCSKIFDTVTKCLAPGGKLLLVIPSQESAHLATSLIDDWRDAQRRRASSGRGAKGRKLKLEESEVSSEEDIAQGVYCRDGVRTKTFTQQQVCDELKARNLMVLSLDKIEYTWDTEYRGDGSRQWMPACGLRPWDWLFIAQHKGMLPQTAEEDSASSSSLPSSTELSSRSDSSGSPTSVLSPRLTDDSTAVPYGPAIS